MSFVCDGDAPTRTRPHVCLAPPYAAMSAARRDCLSASDIVENAALMPSTVAGAAYFAAFSAFSRPHVSFIFFAAATAFSYVAYASGMDTPYCVATFALDRHA